MSNNDYDNKGSLRKVIIIAVIVCVAVVVAGILLSYLIAGHFDSAERSAIETRGLFGDSWGGVNALVSALAFAGVIVTLYLQNRDLNLQREEMTRQRKEFAEENKTIKYQRFENLFYNMLNLQQKIVDGLRYEHVVYEDFKNEFGILTKRHSVKREVVGRDVFRFLFEDVDFSYGPRPFRGYRRYLTALGVKKYDDTMIPTYFDHYFRHLYKIVQFVDSQGFEFDEAYRYVSFLRGTLSRYELVWIYYNALYPDNHKFKKLIEKYSLLKALRQELLTDSLESIDYYNNLGIKTDEVSKIGIKLDFPYFLNESEKDDTKYTISAFWNQNDTKEGLEYLTMWRNYVSKKTMSEK